MWLFHVIAFCKEQQRNEQRNIMHACRTAIVLIAVAVDAQLLCSVSLDDLVSLDDFSLSGLFQDCFYVFVNANGYQNNTKN